MKEIGLHCKNAVARLDAEIKAVEGRSTTRTITGDDIVHSLDYYLSELPDIPKIALEGTTVSVDSNAQNFAKAYRYIPYSTHFSARYHSGHWYITDISRRPCCARGHEYQAELSDTAKAAIIDALSTF